MKKLFLFFLIVCTIQTNAQTKEELFDKTCNQIVTHLAKGEIKQLNKYVKPNIGIYSVERYGAIDAIEFNKVINANFFSYHSPTYIAICKNIKHTDFVLLKQAQSNILTKKENLPQYNCESEKWLLEGIFAGIKEGTDRLTGIINIRKMDEEQYKKLSKQKGIKEIESTARKVIITQYNFVFYLFYANHKWWLGIIDDTEADCSA